MRVRAYASTSTGETSLVSIVGDGPNCSCFGIGTRLLSAAGLTVSCVSTSFTISCSSFFSSSPHDINITRENSMELNFIIFFQLVIHQYGKHLLPSHFLYRWFL